MLAAPSLSSLRARHARRADEDADAGFTLIELLVVVVILGILIAIAIPVYLNYRKSANDKAAQSDLRGAISTVEVCNSDGAYPGTINQTTGAMDTCSGSTTSFVKLSTGTLIRYVAPTATVPTYTMYTLNTGGSNKIYCYNSLSGGGVKPATTGSGNDATALGAATCA